MNKTWNKHKKSNTSHIEVKHMGQEEGKCLCGLRFDLNHPDIESFENFPPTGSICKKCLLEYYELIRGRRDKEGYDVI